jgi:hypothetical protein
LDLLCQSDDSQAESACKEKKRQKTRFSWCFLRKSQKRARETGIAAASARGTLSFSLVQWHFSDGHKLMW